MFQCFMKITNIKKNEYSPPSPQTTLILVHEKTFRQENTDPGCEKLSPGLLPQTVLFSPKDGQKTGILDHKEHLSKSSN